MSAGRKSKAEELGLLETKAEFLAGLLEIDLWSERGLANVAMQAAFAQVRGLLTEAERDALQSGVSIALRALKQERGDTAIARMEAVVIELRKQAESARAAASKARGAAH